MSALIDDLLELIRRQWPTGEVFTSADLKQHEGELLAKHPNITQGSAAIRASMQRLRNRGLVEFEKRGTYKLIR